MQYVFFEARAEPHSLTNVLQHYSAISVGDTIHFKLKGVEYELDVMSCQPTSNVRSHCCLLYLFLVKNYSILTVSQIRVLSASDHNLHIDFLPALDYQEPKHKLHIPPEGWASDEEY